MDPSGAPKRKSTHRKRRKRRKLREEEEEDCASPSSITKKRTRKSKESKKGGKKKTKKKKKAPLPRNTYQEFYAEGEENHPLVAWEPVDLLGVSCFEIKSDLTGGEPLRVEPSLSPETASKLHQVCSDSSIPIDDDAFDLVDVAFMAQITEAVAKALPKIGVHGEIESIEVDEIAVFGEDEGLTPKESASIARPDTTEFIRGILELAADRKGGELFVHGRAHRRPPLLSPCILGLTLFHPGLSVEVKNVSSGHRVHLLLNACIKK